MWKNLKKSSFSFAIIASSIIAIPITFTSCSCHGKKVMNKENPSDGTDKPQSIVSPIEKLSKGGTYNDLNVSGYLSVIETLNLHPTTILSSMNNNKINQMIQTKEEFKNLTIKIQDDSSEENGELFLLISGIYENHSIPPTKIKISNFNTMKKNLYFIDKMSIDHNKYFSNLQTPTTIKTWIEKDWLQYLDTFTFINNNLDQIPFILNALELYKYGILKDMVFFPKNTPNKINLSVIFHKFQGGSWVVENSKSKNVQFQLNDIADLKIPNDAADAQYIIDNLKVAESELKLFSPSYYYNKQQVNLDAIANKIITIDQKLLSAYFPDSPDSVGNLYLETTEIVPDDILGTITFEIKLLDPNNNLNCVSAKSFSFSGLKSISSLMSNYERKEDVVFLHGPSTIKALHRPSPIKLLVESIKKKTTNDALKKLEIGKSLTLSNLDFYDQFKNVVIFRMEGTKTKLDNLKCFWDKGFELELFDQDLLPNIDPQTFLFKSGGFEFGISSIYMTNINEKLDTIITRKGLNNWEVSTKLPFEIRLFGGKIIRLQDVFSILNSPDWEF